MRVERGEGLLLTNGTRGGVLSVQERKKFSRKGRRQRWNEQYRTGSDGRCRRRARRDSVAQLQVALPFAGAAFL